MSERNQRPEESSKMPYITLGVLVLMIAGLLYAGYEYLADDAADVDELLNTPMDTTGKELQPLPTNEEKLALPEVTEGSDVSSVATDEKPATESNDNIALDTPKPTEEEPKKEETKNEEPPKVEKPKPIAVDPGGVEITHTVQAGETFYGIANRYNLNKSTLKGLNPSIADESKDVKSGVTRIKIKVQAVHTVGPGDILRVVADKYGITVAQIMAANKKTKNFAERGEKLIIPFPEKK